MNSEIQIQDAAYFLGRKKVTYREVAKAELIIYVNSSSELICIFIMVINSQAIGM